MRQCIWQTFHTDMTRYVLRPNQCIGYIFMFVFPFQDIEEEDKMNTLEISQFPYSL